MKKIVLIIIFFSTALLYAQPSLKQVRNIYCDSESNRKSCLKMISVLKNYNETNNPVFAGYRACATMMLARFNFNPLNKWYNFREGRGLLEKCISANHENIELRFLRFLVQSNAPGFLGYNTSLAEDKALILKFLPFTGDVQLKQLMIDVLMTSGNLTLTEKKNLNHILL